VDALHFFTHLAIILGKLMGKLPGTSLISVELRSQARLLILARNHHAVKKCVDAAETDECGMEFTAGAFGSIETCLLFRFLRCLGDQPKWWFLPSFICTISEMWSMTALWRCMRLRIRKWLKVPALIPTPRTLKKSWNSFGYDTLISIAWRCMQYPESGLPKTWSEDDQDACKGPVQTEVKVKK